MRLHLLWRSRCRSKSSQQRCQDARKVQLWAIQVRVSDACRNSSNSQVLSRLRCSCLLSREAGKAREWWMRFTVKKGSWLLRGTTSFTCASIHSRTRLTKMRCSFTTLFCQISRWARRMSTKRIQMEHRQGKAQWLLWQLQTLSSNMVPLVLKYQQKLMNQLTLTKKVESLILTLQKPKTRSQEAHSISTLLSSSISLIVPCMNLKSLRLMRDCNGLQVAISTIHTGLRKLHMVSLDRTSERGHRTDKKDRKRAHRTELWLIVSTMVVLTKLSIDVIEQLKIRQSSKVALSRCVSLAARINLDSLRMIIMIEFLNQVLKFLRIVAKTQAMVMRRKRFLMTSVPSFCGKKWASKMLMVRALWKSEFQTPTLRSSQTSGQCPRQTGWKELWHYIKQWTKTKIIHLWTSSPLWMIWMKPSLNQIVQRSLIAHLQTNWPLRSLSLSCSRQTSLVRIKERQTMVNHKSSPITKLQAQVQQHRWIVKNYLLDVEKIRFSQKKSTCQHHPLLKRHRQIIRLMVEQQAPHLQPSI